MYNNYKISFIVSTNGKAHTRVEEFPCELSAQHAVNQLRSYFDGEELRVVNVWVERDRCWEIVEGWE